MAEPAPLAKIPEHLRDSASRYAARMRELGGGRVLSLVLYGRGLDPLDIVTGSIPSVVVLDRVDLAVLRRIAENGTALARLNVAAPVVMIPTFIEASRDTFPLELLEIHQHHVLLLGTDYFATLEIDALHVRLQCERELKTLLVGMHQRLLASGGSESLLGAASAEAGEILLRVLRGLAWLGELREPQRMMRLLAEAEQLIGRELPGVYAAFDQSDTAGWNKFTQLYDDVQALGRYVDALQ